MAQEHETGELERIAFDASRDALAQQAVAVRDLRTRAGTLLAASSFAISFLGGQTLGRGNTGAVASLAVLAFVVSLLAALYVMRANDGLSAAIGGPDLYVELWPVRSNVVELHRRMTYWLARLGQRNEQVLDSLRIGYRIASGALAIQVVLWAALLI